MPEQPVTDQPVTDQADEAGSTTHQPNQVDPEAQVSPTAKPSPEDTATHSTAAAETPETSTAEFITEAAESSNEPGANEPVSGAVTKADEVAIDSERETASELETASEADTGIAQPGQQSDEGADSPNASEPEIQPETQPEPGPSRGRSRRRPINRQPAGLAAPKSSKLTLAQSFQRSGSIAKVAGSQLLRETGEGLVSLSEWLDNRTSEADSAAAANVREGLEDQFSGSWQRWGNILAKLKAPLPKPLRRLSDTSITGILVGLLVFLLLALSSLFQSPSSIAKGTAATVATDSNGYDIQAPLSRKASSESANRSTSSNGKLIQSRPSTTDSQATAAKDSSPTGSRKPTLGASEPSGSSTTSSKTTSNAKATKKSLSAADFFGEDSTAPKAPSLKKPAPPSTTPRTSPYGAAGPGTAGYGAPYGNASSPPAAPFPATANGTNGPAGSEAYPPGYPPAPYPYPPYFYPPLPYPGSEAPNAAVTGPANPGSPSDNGGGNSPESQGSMPMTYPGYGAYPYPYPVPGYPLPYGQQYGQPGSYPKAGSDPKESESGPKPGLELPRSSSSTGTSSQQASAPADNTETADSNRLKK